MRLRRLDLTRYGRFTDRVLDFGPAPTGQPDMTLVYGPNEAGKSTAFDAWLSLLFGVPARSGYAFLHSYSTMQVGGVLESGGRTHELVRTKGNANDLRTAAGEVLAPGALTPMLGTLTRDSYRAMFSLDDDSLEEGGRAILESKGELGQMLFTASSGLPGMAAALVQVRAEAEALFKPGRSRSHRLQELKAKLDKATEELRALEVPERHYVQLRDAARAASAAYEDEAKSFAAREAKLKELQRLARALPLASERLQVLARREPVRHRPAPPAGWPAQADAMATQEAALDAQRQSLDIETTRLRAARDALPLDAQLLVAEPDILRLDENAARHRTAELDLPKRAQKREQDEVALAGLRTDLGVPADVPLQKVCLPAPLMARLSELADAHAGLAKAQEASGAEAARASAELKEAEARAAAAPPLADAAALEAELARLGQEGTGASLAGLQAKIAEEQAALAALLDGLKPFVGDPAGLAALSAPGPAQVQGLAEGLATATADLRQARADTTSRQATLQREIARTETLRQQTGLADDAALADLARQREALWQAHGAGIAAGAAHTALAASAAAYGTAAAAEREALNTGLRQASDLGQWRAAMVARAEAESDAAQAAGQLAKAAAAHSEARQALDAALAACGLPAGWPAEEFRLWLQRREAALQAGRALALHRQQAEALAARVAEDRAGLERLLAASGQAVAPGSSHGALLAQAQTLARTLAAERSTRAAEAAALAKLRLAAAERQRQQGEDEKRLQAWQQQWREALAGTWLASEPPPGLAQVRTALRLIASVSQLVAGMKEVATRIAAMEQDQRSFVAGLEAVCRAAGQPLDPANPLASFERLKAALAAERERASLRAQVEKDLADKEDKARKVAAAMQELARTRAAMLAHYDVTTTAELREALREGEANARLTEALERLEASLLDTLRLPTLEAALARLEGLSQPAVEAEATVLEEEHNAAQQALQALHHEARTAEQAFRAIAADDRVALLQEERRTLLLEMQELAGQYLRLRIGADAVDVALRSYRDSHRSSMLREASERFSTITLGSFSGLRTQPGDKGDVLVGIQAGGASLLADAMSKGTQDQLYLALRMAGYLEFVKTREPLPFIADDILETFDDQRAAATFCMLADIARHGQVIYFTHHEHLCTLARNACGAHIQVLRL
jgi:uncharacterized protein YhaN